MLEQGPLLGLPPLPQRIQARDARARHEQLPTELLQVDHHAPTPASSICLSMSLIDLYSKLSSQKLKTPQLLPPPDCVIGSYVPQKRKNKGDSAISAAGVTTLA